jgi:hypothetical protein
MIATQAFRHKDYELTCGARAIDNGRFEPTLIVAKQAWPRRPRTIAVHRGQHLTPDVAIQAAHAQGLEWVNNFG